MTKPTDRQIEYVRLADLKVNPKNPKAHHLDTIDASVGRFGFVEPIVKDDRTGSIISGHGRRTTLIEMEKRGEDPPEGVRLDPKGAWLVPVSVGWSSRTDTEAAAALIALNRTTEMGGWVDESLLDMLDSLSEVEDGFDGVGFGEADLDDLRAKLAAAQQALDPAMPPEDFTEYGQDIATQYCCPSCSYTWSGHPAPNLKESSDPDDSLI